MVLATFALATAIPARAEERFVVPRPDGWKLAFRTTQPQLSVTEFVPATESVEKWTEMVTSQTFAGLRNVSVDGYLQRIAAEAVKVCESVEVTPITTGSLNGYPTAVMALFCTRYTKTGLGEITLYKVILGRDALYIAYRSWRGAPFQQGTQPVSKADLDTWATYLDRVTLCDGADKDRPCPE
jgi:hypothetical protein